MNDTHSLPPVQPAEILAEIELPDVDMIHGVSCDGCHVWCAAGPRNDLLCIDPAAGRLVRQLGRGDCAAGTTWDGACLWQICGDRIHRIDRATGATLRSIPAPSEHCAGLAWAQAHLWVGVFSDRRIFKVDPQNGAVVKTLASDRLVTGVTWAGAELWHGTYPEHDEEIEPGELRRIDPAHGAVLARVHLPAGTRISGTEFDGRDRIWVGSRTTKNTLRAVRKP